MNKTELIKAISHMSGYKQKDIKNVLDVMESIVFATFPTEEVKIMNGLSLTCRTVPEHEARNPATNETVIVPKRIHPKAVIGSALKRVAMDSQA